MSELNTIYIISKGRPGCKTAQTLTSINYPGEWFIVCGNNDETLPEYEQLWGDRVLVFDWYDEITRTDTLDNFGFDDMPSGACPVRNATRRISEERGERRHWQLDDDYNGFYVYPRDGSGKKQRVTDGKVLCDTMQQLAEFADGCGMQNIGFCLGAESYPENRKKFGRRVFNAHNMPNDPEKFQRWRGRMNDDLINAIEVWRNGGYEILMKHAVLSMPPTQCETGGMTELYEAEGTVRKTAYAVMMAPNAVKLAVKYGRYHHQANWDRIVPKLLREDFRRA